MILDILTAALLLAGSAFFLIAAIGIVRLPDLYMRMHAAAKASAFGAVLLLLGVALHFGDGWTLFEVFIIIIFLFITTPVATHLIGRAGYHMKVPMWKETQVDELHEAMLAEMKDDTDEADSRQSDKDCI